LGKVLESFYSPTCLTSVPVLPCRNMAHFVSYYLERKDKKKERPGFVWITNGRNFIYSCICISLSSYRKCWESGYKQDKGLGRQFHDLIPWFEKRKEVEGRGFRYFFLWIHC